MELQISGVLLYLYTLALFFINSIIASYAALLRFPWLASGLQKKVENTLYQIMQGGA